MMYGIFVFLIDALLKFFIFVSSSFISSSGLRRILLDGPLSSLLADILFIPFCGYYQFFPAHYYYGLILASIIKIYLSHIVFYAYILLRRHND